MSSSAEQSDHEIREEAERHLPKRAVGPLTSKEQLTTEALSTAFQALLEVQHAMEVGPEWYTRGATGLRSQVRTWVSKGLKAIDEARNAHETNDCQHRETNPIADTHATWCPECGAFHDGTQWVHPWRAEKTAVQHKPGCAATRTIPNHCDCGADATEIPLCYWCNEPERLHKQGPLGLFCIDGDRLYSPRVQSPRNER